MQRPEILKKKHSWIENNNCDYILTVVNHQATSLCENDTRKDYRCNNDFREPLRVVSHQEELIQLPDGDNGSATLISISVWIS